jgi:hypothetical protein
MELSKIKNKKDFIEYMKPYGNHVEFIVGNYYAICIVNMDYDMYEIRKYSENYHKKNTRRLIQNGCKPIEIKSVSSEECVKLIISQFIKQQRKEKLEKINGRV